MPKFLNFKNTIILTTHLDQFYDIAYLFYIIKIFKQFYGKSEFTQKLIKIVYNINVYYFNN